MKPSLQAAERMLRRRGRHLAAGAVGAAVMVACIGWGARVLLGHAVLGGTAAHPHIDLLLLSACIVVLTLLGAAYALARRGLANDMAALRRLAEQDRRAERRLRTSEARLRAVFEQTAVGIALHAVDGMTVRRVDVNAAFCRMLGVSRETLMAQAPGAAVHPDDAPRSRETLRQLLAGEVPAVVLEQRYLHSSGRHVWMRVSASIAHGDDDGARYVVSVLEDVSQARFAQLELERARSRELAIGARIQQALLVSRSQADVPGVWLGTFNQASQGIDGDFVEVIRHGPLCVDVVSGDVMGKGVNAALIGAAVKMQISRTLAELLTRRAEQGARGPLPTPSEIVADVHRAMTPMLQELDAFVTMSYVRIDAARGLLTWVGCGHEEPLLARADGGVEALANQHPPLGVVDGQHYEQASTRLDEGDGLLLHSDGVSDARMPGGERVGRDRLREAFARAASRHGTPAAVVQVLRRELLADAEVEDDLTMVFARVPPRGQRRLELPRNAAAIAAVRGAVQKMALQEGVGGTEVDLFEVAVVEAFTNVVRHASGVPDRAPVELLLAPSRGTLAVELVYAADAYVPPSELPGTRLEDLPEGGFGLSIIQRSCDRVDYRMSSGICTTRLELWHEVAWVA